MEEKEKKDLEIDPERDPEIDREAEKKEDEDEEDDGVRAKVGYVNKSKDIPKNALMMFFMSYFHILYFLLLC